MLTSCIQLSAIGSNFVYHFLSSVVSFCLLFVRHLQLTLAEPGAAGLCSAAGRDIGALINAALGASKLFMSAALPLHVMPPMFNRYEGGQTFGTHIDNAVRVLPNGQRIRTDLSCTLFLTAPEDYDGGELVVEDTYGTKNVKLPAGHMIVYPATSLHHVTPVTRGCRVSSFFWLQSMIRDNTQRALLYDMDVAIQRLGAGKPTDPSVISLTGIYHNLLRQWAEL